MIDFSMKKDSDLMSIKQVADDKGITVGRVYQLIDEGTLNADKVGKMYIIRRADVEALTIHGKPGRPKKEKSIKGNGETNG